MEENKKLKIIIAILITIIFTITILLMGSGVKVQDTCNKAWKNYISYYCTCNIESLTTEEVIKSSNFSFKPNQIG